MQEAKNMKKKIINFFLSLLPLRNIIIFQSFPIMTDNTKAVFDEMIKRGLNKKYKMIWTYADKSKTLPEYENVTFLDLKRVIDDINFKLLRRFAKCFISCNGFLSSERKGQASFYITHGTPIKSVETYYNVPSTVDYIIVDGEATREVTMSQLKGDINKCFALGYPRNDILNTAERDLHEFFPNNKEDKIIIWYPTFRQHKNVEISFADKALPILHDEKMAQKLNSIAKEHNILLVIKPHFAQDISKLKTYDLSNIKFIDDSFYVNNNILPYEFIANSDALISDYSSVYFDYLICDKPIGLVWEDYDDYKNTVDFAIDMEYFMRGGEKIYNLEDFEVFLKNVSENNDKLKNERAEISKWANYSRDAKSAERVTDFIIEKAKL